MSTVCILGNITAVITYQDIGQDMAMRLDQGLDVTAHIIEGRSGMRPINSLNRWVIHFRRILDKSQKKVTGVPLGDRMFPKLEIYLHETACHPPDHAGWMSHLERLRLYLYLMRHRSLNLLVFDNHHQQARQMLQFCAGDENKYINAHKHAFPHCWYEWKQILF